MDAAEFLNLTADLYFRELAFQSAVRLIGNAVSKCEFRTFFRGKEVRDQEYYLFNIEPNKNQNSSEFIQKWITALYERNEALVIEDNGQLLVVDSFSKTEYALYGHRFTGVTVNGFTFNRSFEMADVMYFKLGTTDVRRVLAGLYESYGALLTYAMKAFKKSRGIRGILNISMTASGKPNFEETLSKLMNERFKTFFTADNAVLPLTEGYSFNDIGSKTYSNEGTRDIRAMVDDIFDFTARAFCIPPALLRGDLADTEKAMNNFLTFCVDPLCDMIEEEINRKRVGYEGFAAGTYLTIDTKTIKHVDLLGVATAIDKLISSGSFCINDIRKLVGEAPIDSPWANQHFMTKNYETVSSLLNAAGGSTPEGGENI